MKLGLRRASGLLTLLLLLPTASLVAGCHKKAADGDAANAASDGTSGGGGGKRGHGGAGGAAGAAPATPVQVQKVENGNIAATVQITGNVDALHDIQVAAKTPGRILAVNFREGDLVKAGQVVVQQDTTDLQATVRQDEALLLADQAKVDQANETLRIQQTQAKQNVLNAQATLAGAQQNYKKYKGGNRPQDILQAEATTLQAKAQRDQALVTLNRDKILYPQGAIAKATLDADQSTYESDQALYVKAQAAEALEKAGYQQEDINSAQQQVREQEANLQNQVANQRQVAVQKGAVEAANAVVKQDLAKIAYDRTQVGYAVIRSPIDGVVAARETEPGELATSGTALMRIVNIDTLYYQPTISETDFSATHAGDKVRVTVDALPGKTFAGRVAALYPAADTSTRVFSLRVEMDNSQHTMRPGMFARGTLTTHVARNVPVVPTSALVTTSAQVGFEANDSSNAPVSQGLQLPAQQIVVLSADGQSVEVRPATLGIVTMTRAQITSGVQAGEQIVVVGQQGLKTGDKVTTVTAQSAGGAGATGGGGGGRHHKGGGAAGAGGTGGATAADGATPTGAGGGGANAAGGSTDTAAGGAVSGNSAAGAGGPSSGGAGAPASGTGAAGAAGGGAATGGTH